MLKTALNNDHIEMNPSCEIKVSVTSLIPEYYLPSPTERLKIYRKLSGADSKTLTVVIPDLVIESILSTTFESVAVSKKG